MHLGAESIHHPIPPPHSPDQHTPMYLFKEAINVKEKDLQVPRTSDSGSLITNRQIDNFLSLFDLHMSEWCTVTGLT